MAVLGLLGFWLFPEEPAVPALLLTAVAVPIAVVGLVVTSILVRRDIARAEDDDEAYYELGPMEPDSPDNG